MFPNLHRKFLIITPSLASAFPEATSTITTSAHSATTSSPSFSPSLPVSLQALIPDCAQACVESILLNEWPLGCSSSGDLECLCSQYSTTGLTLGEAAYGCAMTSCPSSTPDLASTYSICSDQDGAVVATHSTLTFTAHITSTAESAGPSASSTAISSTAIRTNTTSTRNSSSTSSSRRSSRTTLDASTTPASSTSSVPFPTTAQSSASSSAAAAATAGSSSDDGNGLSTAQIVGISVASVSAVVLAIGVLFLMACLRKRDKKKQGEVSEKRGRSMFALTPPSHDNVLMSPTALEQFPSPPRNRKDPRNGAGVGTGITIPQVRVDVASPPRQRAPTPLENIGLAITEDSPIASPASFSSNRTMSQLLPDKPEPSMPAKPAPVPKSPVPTSAPFIAKRKKAERDSSMSQNTVFEEDTAVRKAMYPAKAVSVPPRKQPPSIVAPARPYRPRRALRQSTLKPRQLRDSRRCLSRSLHRGDSTHANPHLLHRRSRLR
ncbi:hypothetical protein B0J12DRAFT_254272 [Macrophomina phaseolina]|uniref:CFEM domain-containing protein n=1 Tax=Macrophomina phaseolina TaxID=35725 RepID=A0ABQ8FZZ2_9PEZI|nr:hypothetical protein B0J12DRAFT_254272 [Macrophomina phaseolina]